MKQHIFIVFYYSDTEIFHFLPKPWLTVLQLPELCPPLLGEEGLYGDQSLCGASCRLPGTGSTQGLKLHHSLFMC